MTRRRIRKSQTEMVFWISEETIDREQWLAIMAESLLVKAADRCFISPLPEPIQVNELSFCNCQFTDDALHHETFIALRNITSIRIQDCVLTPQQTKQIYNFALSQDQVTLIERVDTKDEMRNGYWLNLGYLLFWTWLWRRQWMVQKNENTPPELVMLLSEYQSWIVQAMQLQLELHWFFLWNSELGIEIFNLPEFSQWQTHLQNLLITIKNKAECLSKSRLHDHKVMDLFLKDLVAELQVLLPKLSDPHLSKTCEFNYYIMLVNYRMLRYCALVAVGSLNILSIKNELASFKGLYANGSLGLKQSESPVLKWMRITIISFFCRVKEILFDWDPALQGTISEFNSKVEISNYISAVKALSYSEWGSAFMYDILFGLYTCFEQNHKLYVKSSQQNHADLATKSLNALEYVIQNSPDKLSKNLVASLLFKNHYGVDSLKPRTENLKYIASIDQKIMHIILLSELSLSMKRQTTALHGLRISQIQCVEYYHRMVLQGAIAIKLRTDVAYHQAAPPKSRANLSEEYLRAHPTGLKNCQPNATIICDLGLVTSYSLNEIWRKQIQPMDRWKVYNKVYPTIGSVSEFRSYLTTWENALNQFEILACASFIFDMNSPIAGFVKSNLYTHYCNVIFLLVDFFRLFSPLVKSLKFDSELMNTNEKTELNEYRLLYQTAIEYCGFLLEPRLKEFATQIPNFTWSELAADILGCQVKAQNYLTRLDTYLEDYQKKVAEQERRFWLAFRSLHQNNIAVPQLSFRQKNKVFKKKPAAIAPRPKEELEVISSVEEGEEQETPAYIQRYPVLQKIHALTKSAKHAEAIQSAKKALDEIVLQDRDYPLIAYLCYVIADCQHFIEGKECDAVSAKQFSPIAFEYLSQAMHYLTICESKNLIEDDYLQQVFGLLKKVYAECPLSLAEKPAPSHLPAKIQEEKLFFTFPPPLFQLLSKLQLGLMSHLVYIFGSTPLAAVFSYYHPDEPPIPVHDTDIVIFVADFAKANQWLIHLFPTMRPAFFEGLFRGTIDGMDIDILLIDSTKTNPFLFVSSINMRCSGLLVAPNGEILDLSGLSLDAIRKKEASLMPGVIVQQDKITILNYLQKQSAYRFSGNVSDSSTLSTQVSVLRGVEPHVLRQHLFKAFHNGYAKQAYHLWDKHHVFSIILPVMYAMRHLLRDEFLKVCSSWDDHHARTQQPFWLTALGMISAWLKVVVEHALTSVEENEKSRVAQAMVLESDAHLLKDFSVFDRINILRLGGFKLFVPQNVPLDCDPVVSPNTEPNLLVPKHH